MLSVPYTEFPDAPKYPDRAPEPESAEGPRDYLEAELFKAGLDWETVERCLVTSTLEVAT